MSVDAKLSPMPVFQAEEDDGDDLRNKSKNYTTSRSTSSNRNWQAPCWIRGGWIRALCVVSCLVISFFDAETSDRLWTVFFGRSICFVGESNEA